MKSNPLSSIVRLFLPGRPAAVLQAVSLGIIISFNGEVWRSVSHIGNKILEYHPAFTDSHSTRPVTKEVLAIWIRTSLNHTSPYRIDTTSILRPSVTVLNQSKTPEASMFKLGASTRDRLPHNETIASHSYNLSAGAEAITPSDGISIFRSCVWGIRNYFELAKCSTDKDALFLRHNVAFINVVFSSGRPATTGAHCDTNELSNPRKNNIPTAETALETTP